MTREDQAAKVQAVLDKAEELGYVVTRTDGPNGDVVLTIDLSEPTGNYTLRGSSIGSFAVVISVLSYFKALWSSVCDKHGDWLVSTGDDTPLKLTKAVADLVGCEVLDKGELVTSLESVPEYKEFLETQEIYPPAEPQKGAASEPDRDRTDPVQQDQRDASREAG